MKENTQFPPSPWAEGPYSVKRHGVTLTNCDQEPVQTPGCIQSHGVLLALRLSDLTLVQVSDNTGYWLGLPPEQLLGASVSVVIGPERTLQLREVLTREPIDHNPLYVFTLPKQAEVEPLDVMVHTAGGVVLLELEASGRQSGLGEPDYYTLLKKTVTRLQAAQSLFEFCHQVTEEIRELTGLDRVMVYRFHADQHGEVIGESKRAELPPWLGQHYPAEDVPQPAREIFMKIWIRPLPDAQAPLAEMVPLANPDTGKALEMTYCALRGASIMYTEYLHNMGVAASLTMPIQRDGRLWGLIACHHYEPTHFPYPLRAACEFMAQMVSLQIKAVEDREHLQYRLNIESAHSQILAAAAHEMSLTALTEGQHNLLNGIAAEGVALYHQDRWWCLGQTPSPAQLDALSIWLSDRPELAVLNRPVYVTECLSRDYPPGAELSKIASGVLAVSLSLRYRSFLLWFRPETLQTINWAGSPHDKPTVAGPNGPRLSPRASFELYVESVKCRSLPWLEVEIEAAVRLRLSIMEIVVGRAEQLATLNADLTRSNDDLETFAYVASHDLKEPLRGIAKYAHQLMESATSLDEENRQRLNALLRLTGRMDSLLNSLLTYSRLGRANLRIETVNLNEVRDEALDITSARSNEKPTEIIFSQPLPTLPCDRTRVREIFVNLITNALKYNDNPLCRIEIGCWLPGSPEPPANLPALAHDQPVLYVRDNGIGIESRHFQQIFKIFKRLHPREAYDGGTGVGLTIVNLLIERHHGALWLESKPGVGSTFYFTLGGDNHD
jgi:two-component system, chemotaxis family, sensor kinase Cph1